MVLARVLTGCGKVVFKIDPSGNYLVAANQDSGSVVVFKRNAATGRLTPTGQTVNVGSAVCVEFLPVD